MVCTACLLESSIHTEVCVGPAEDRSLPLVVSFWELGYKNEELMSPRIPHEETRVLSGRGLFIRHWLVPHILSASALFTALVLANGAVLGFEWLPAGRALLPACSEYLFSDAPGQLFQRPRRLLPVTPRTAFGSGELLPSGAALNRWVVDKYFSL